MWEVGRWGGGEVEIGQLVEVGGRRWGGGEMGRWGDGKSGG